MNLPSLSISSSKRTTRTPLLAALWVAAWIGIGLAVTDALINVVFPYPNDPKNTNPSRFSLYFDYGRSSEAKLARMTRADPSETAPITLAGWYEPLRVDEFPSAVQKPIVTFYGMSHAVRLAGALARVSDRFTPRVVGAPGATANWEYGAYLRDRGGHKSSSCSPRLFIFQPAYDYEHVAHDVEHRFSNALHWR